MCTVAPSDRGSSRARSSAWYSISLFVPDSYVVTRTSPSSNTTEAFAFCPHCGATFTEQPEPREQRKVVTVLFCDVMGSTELGEKLDPETLRALLARYFERMKGLVITMRKESGVEPSRSAAPTRPPSTPPRAAPQRDRGYPLSFDDESEYGGL